MKYLRQFREHYSRSPSFTTKDALIFLSQFGTSKAYIYLLLSNLVKKGEIKKLRHGVYTFGSDPSAASSAFSPSYHGLQDALSVLGLWDQGTNTIILTPRKVRVGMREVLGAHVLVRRISRSMFFGFEPVKYFDQWIPVSDVEKTLIDFVYFKEPLQKDVLVEFKSRLDKKKLAKYLKRCPVWVKKRVKKLFVQI